MAENNNSSLTFSVEESVWFKKGQEVQEVLSMSLEPEISIEERGDHISITGALQLVGEYVPKDENEASLREVAHANMIEDVTVSDDGIGELAHRFPVDITIPTDKVRSLDDIYVIIDSFDYELPEDGSLKLAADIIISGIYQGEARKEQHQPSYEEENNNVVSLHADHSDHAEHTEFEVETRKLPEQQEVDHSNSYNMTDETEAEAEVEEEKSYSPQIEMKSRAEETTVRHDNSANQSYWVNEMNVDNQEAAYRNSPQEEYEQDEDETTEAEQPRQSSAKRDENALYLTKMLSGDDEDERFSRLRMCIAQQGETLQAIAERYNVSVSQLQRINRLDTEDIGEGQIVYIPNSVHSI
ncbi:stage VI sporulation protein D [Lottiidibacillus patelloidae]|nr:stage VI sporulation protein D [Lottiidibacillus patelloidae]